ncbi:hypothetical protein ACE193_03315 [Bernardetia sp. OM2101]|uniref:hypothetical protein n=1 Tax=Bernardetia sp. OM2101 TaxID=3344876 RepID=UPI0035CFCA73
MKKYLFVLFFILNFISFSFAQKVDSLYDCATPYFTKSQMQELPWYGNNQYLLNTL